MQLCCTTDNCNVEPTGVVTTACEKATKAANKPILNIAKDYTPAFYVACAPKGVAPTTGDCPASCVALYATKYTACKPEKKLADMVYADSNYLDDTSVCKYAPYKAAATGKIDCEQHMNMVNHACIDLGSGCTQGCKDAIADVDMSCDGDEKLANGETAGNFFWCRAFCLLYPVLHID